MAEHQHARAAGGRSRALRRVGVLVAAGCVAALPLTIGAGSATAGDQRYCGITDVPESAGSPVSVMTLAPGQTVTLSPGGSIWAGVWFTGWNGPAGWDAVAPSGAGYPLPGAREYSLIAQVSGQSWRYVGASTSSITNNSSYPRELSLWINDSWHGNGSGAFSAMACYYA
jgi:hypothetical protein